NHVNKTNKTIIGHMIYIATKIAKILHIDKQGYRIVINCNDHAGQEVQHLHLHVLGGQKLSNNFN
ncbi:HIT domain-containing protein, partial [Buchnera aphidicola (Hormaphis cornu)]